MAGMTDEQKRALDAIMAMLRKMPPDERAEVCSYVIHNDEFCVYCGTDTSQRDGVCHCRNDA